MPHPPRSERETGLVIKLLADACNDLRLLLVHESHSKTMILRNTGSGPLYIVVSRLLAALGEPHHIPSAVT